MAIDKMTRRDAAAADLVAFWSTANGEDSATSFTQFIALIQAQLASATYQPQFVAQYEAPETGGNVDLPATSNNIWLQLRPAGTLATLGISLPSSFATSKVTTNGQEVIITSTQTITTLAMDSNGATGVGSPATLVANRSFRMKYDETFNQWVNLGGIE